MTTKTLHLVVFDFDNTVIDCNSDTFIDCLCTNSVVPKRVKDTLNDNNWTEYMSELFKYLHEIGVREEDYKSCLVKMPLIDGMKDLILNLKNKSNEDSNGEKGCGFELIIISDSNSFFIETFLEYNGLDKSFREVFTNNAHFADNGCLTIEPYHKQDYCDISAVNLCKGNVLQEYIKRRKNDGVTFNLISYVGDGQNDLCPGLTLSSNDHLFARKDFRLHKIILKKPDDLKAKFDTWTTGYDISKVLQIGDFPKETTLTLTSPLPKSTTPPTPPPSPALQNVTSVKGDGSHCLPIILSQIEAAKVTE